MKKYTIDISRGERLRLDRERMGLSQVQAAKAKNLSLHAYRKLEKNNSSESVPTDVYEYEDFRIQRWRVQFSRKKFAKILKLSEYWISEMEFGRVSCDRLRTFWETYAAQRG